MYDISSLDQNKITKYKYPTKKIKYHTKKDIKYKYWKIPLNTSSSSTDKMSKLLGRTPWSGFKPR